jgi:hypothetical protein
MKLARLAQDIGCALRAAAGSKGGAGAGQLDAYWTSGEGAAKIRWGQPCAFCRCKDQLGKYPSGNRLEGHCANLQKKATGQWPNAEGSRVKRCPC